jgi:SPP1 gp7 family putative phage head morphogenesis protein
MKTAEYFKQRAMEREAAAQTEANELVRLICAAYDRAADNIDGEINSALKQLYKQLGGEENYKNAPKSAIRRLLEGKEAAPYKARISRLGRLKEAIKDECALLGGYEAAMDAELFAVTVEQGYYRSVFDLQRGAESAFSFVLLSERAIENVINKHFAGKHFSARIWTNTGVLADKLQETITAGFLSGASISKMRREIEPLTNAGKYAAARIIRTEVNYFQNQAELLALKEAGIKHYVFLATLDSRTSEICRELDLKAFDVDKAEPGVNYPPMHPNCRSTVYGEIEGFAPLARRARDPETGENTVVPGDMNYREWYEKNVKGNAARGGKGLTAAAKGGIMAGKGVKAMGKERTAAGRRKSRFNILSEKEIDGVKAEIKIISADTSLFRFNEGQQTGYSDRTKLIHVKGDIFPDIESSHPRDIMSVRAVLAHEYYGHYKFAPSQFVSGDWRDEMRASYIAALKAPNLTDEDRANLIRDAYLRAEEAGRHYEYSKKAREILYGYSD